MGIGLIVLGAAAFAVGFWLPRALRPSAGRNRPGEVAAAVIGPFLVVAGVVVLALGR